MEIKNYTYTPDIPEVFTCRVPLPDTVQAFVNNGVLRASLYDTPEGVSIAGSEGLGYNLSYSKEASPNNGVQVISFRDSSNINDISFINKFVFGERSKSNVLLCTHTLSMDNFNTQEDFDIELKDGAISHIVVMQNEHNGSNHSFNFNINLSNDSFLRLTVVTLHGNTIKNTYNVNLNGKNSLCDLNGTYLVDGDQQISNTITMNHLVPECVSHQLFKGILDDASKATFIGRIVVAKDAQKTQAYQSNHNLLVSPKAKAYAQPQLEIYADDVKCSHGATSGILDSDALFYMRSRGIGKDEAKLLQQMAFVYAVIEKINNESLRARLLELIESRLRGEFSHCANCSMNCC